MRKQMVLGLAAVLIVGLWGCSSTPAEEDPLPPEPEVTQQMLAETIEAYVPECVEMCAQNEQCTEGPSRYRVEDCERDCRSNRYVVDLEIDNLAGMQGCFDAYIDYSQCVTELECEGWASWQEHRSDPDAQDYPCREATVQAHRRCSRFASELAEAAERAEQAEGAGQQ